MQNPSLEQAPGQHSCPDLPQRMGWSQHIPIKQCPEQHAMFPAGPPRWQHVAFPPQHCGLYGEGQHCPRATAPRLQHVPRFGIGPKSDMQQASRSVAQTAVSELQHVCVETL